MLTIDTVLPANSIPAEAAGAPVDLTNAGTPASTPFSVALDCEAQKAQVKLAFTLSEASAPSAGTHSSLAVIPGEFATPSAPEPLPKILNRPDSNAAIPSLFGFVWAEPRWQDFPKPAGFASNETITPTSEGLPAQSDTQQGSIEAPLGIPADEAPQDLALTIDGIDTDAPVAEPPLPQQAVAVRYVPIEDAPKAADTPTAGEFTMRSESAPEPTLRVTGAIGSATQVKRGQVQPIRIPSPSPLPRERALFISQPESYSPSKEQKEDPSPLGEGWVRGSGLAEPVPFQVRPGNESRFQLHLQKTASLTTGQPQIKQPQGSVDSLPIQEPAVLEVMAAPSTGGNHDQTLKISPKSPDEPRGDTPKLAATESEPRSVSLQPHDRKLGVELNEALDGTFDGGTNLSQRDSARKPDNSNKNVREIPIALTFEAPKPMTMLHDRPRLGRETPDKATEQGGAIIAKNMQANDIPAGFSTNSVLREPSIGATDTSKAPAAVLHESEQWSQIEKSNVLSQLVEKAHALRWDRNSEIVITLKPETLGRINMRATFVDRTMVATITAESDRVRQLIQLELPVIHRSLEQSGIAARVEVSQQHFDLTPGNYSSSNGQPRFRQDERTFSSGKETAPRHPTATLEPADSRYGVHSVHLIA